MRRGVHHQGRDGHKRVSLREDALSEMVSSLTLIVVLVVAAGIILSFSTGQYPKVTIPFAEISVENTSDYTYFSHDGGENLSFTEISQINVFPEGQSPKTISHSSNELEIIVPGNPAVPWNTVQDTDFSYGAKIRIPRSSPIDESYQLIYRGVGSGEYVYRQYGGGGSGLNPISTPLPICEDKCTILVSNALFIIDDKDAPVYRFLLENSSCEDCSHEWIVSGPGFTKAMSEKNLSITLPLLSYNTVYSIQHIVTQIKCGSPICSRSYSKPLTVTGCSEICDPQFKYQNTGMVATFTDLTEGSNSQYWDFGDGYYSSDNPTIHTYSGEKTSYFVTLTVNKTLCGVITRCPSVTKRISLNCDGDTTFTAIYQEPSRNPWNVTFTWNTNYEKPYTLIWDFGDGTQEIIPRNDWTGSKSHPYYQCKDYSATLYFNTDECGSYSSTRTINLPCVCINNPFANFSIVKTNIGTPFEIEITDHSIPATGHNIISWVWDMGDGNVLNNTSADPPGTFPYSYPGCGEYSIHLTVFDSQGCWDDSTRIISCGGDSCTPGIPDANFTYSQDPGNRRQFHFTDTSTPVGLIERWQWDMGDGTRYDDIPDPSHTYASFGNFTVKLRVWDKEGCWGDAIQDVSSSCPVPSVNFTITANPNDSQEFTFSDTSIIPTGVSATYYWDFGDGSSSNQQNPTHRYATCDIFKVRLKVTTNCGSWDDAVKNAICGCQKPEAAFRIEGTSDPQKFRFINESRSVRPITSIHWDFGDGTDSIDPNPTHRYDDCSQYTVRLTVTTDCGSSDDAILDAICGCPPPTPDFDYSCIGPTKVNFTDLSRATGGNIDSWYWEFGDGITSDLPNPEHEYTNAGTYQVSLNITTNCGSSARWTRLITVPCCEMPTPDFTYTCNPDGKTVNFVDKTKTTGDTISDWLWEFGDGNTSQVQNPVYTYSGSGTWKVNLTATTDCGASNTYSGSLTTPCFCTPPIANFTTEILSGEPFVVRIVESSMPDDGSLTNWYWEFGDGTSFTGQNPSDHTYTAGCGEYLISLTVTNDCGKTDTFDALVCCPVYANFTYRMEPPDGTAPATVYFTDRTIGTPQSWGWTFGDGGFSSFRNPVHTYTQGGNYSATLHATSTCGGNESHSEQINIYCPPVEALFNYTIINEDPLTVQFTDLSTGYDIVEWNWYFDDGSSSTEQHPVHIYNIRDDYQVILTIKNSCGSESQNSMYLPIGCLPLTIVATAHEGGSISPSGNVIVPCEWNQQFNITPHTCYDIYDVVIDKDQPNVQHLGPINNYTFVNVQFDQTIDAYFQLKHPQISASANQGGTIDPPGITHLDCGSDQTYTITTESCYNITDVIINGTERLGPQISPFTYTFTNVTTDQAIQAQFALKTFPINATAGEGGVISPTGIIYVLCGYNQVFTITSDNCYEISSVLINEIPLPGPFISPFQYTFPNVLQPQTIDAEFSFKNYNITASSGSNGRIVPSGIISVGCGSDRTLTIVPDSGYVVTDIIVNGESVGSYSSYTLSNIQSDQTIHVDFGLSRNWCPITGNVRTQGGTGTGVPGIRVDVWNQARTILERSGISRADGSYTIMYPRQSGTHRIDLNCPSTTTWTTTSPSGGWVDNAQICNRNGACVALSQNFRGRIIT